MKLVKSIRLKYIMCLLSVSILPVLFLEFIQSLIIILFITNKWKVPVEMKFTEFLLILTEIMKM